VRAPVAPQLSGAPANVAEAYARLAADIASGARTLPDFEAAVRLSRLLEAIDAAARTGKRKSLSWQSLP
jgi:predicted dehydrogenase